LLKSVFPTRKGIRLLGVSLAGLEGADENPQRITRDLKMAVVGSRSYFADRQPPQVPADLKDHICLTYKWKSTGALYPWRFADVGGPINIDVEDVLTVNDTDLLLSAACEGVGLAYLVDDVVAPFLEKGDLIRVLEPWCKPFPGFYLYYSERTHMPASLRAFIDFMKVTSR
jgi:DNA-binding transcriptional LysR family regulator